MILTRHDLPNMTSDSFTNVELGPAKLRILDAARQLFSVHGVAGTSLQMIADEIGVTKAAVYHQYKAKEDIVYAVGEQVNTALAIITETALKETTAAKRRQVLLNQIIHLAVSSRQISGALQHDPNLLRLFREQAPFKRVMDRLNSVLLGDNQSPEAKVTVAAIITCIAGAVMHPICDDVDNEVLIDQLTQVVKAMVKLL